MNHGLRTHSHWENVSTDNFTTVQWQSKFGWRDELQSTVQGSCLMVSELHAYVFLSFPTHLFRYQPQLAVVLQTLYEHAANWTPAKGRSVEWPHDLGHDIPTDHKGYIQPLPPRQDFDLPQLERQGTNGPPRATSHGPEWNNLE